MSMNPGARTSPSASRVVSAGPSTRGPTSTIRSPTVATFAGNAGCPDPSSTCAPRIRNVYTRQLPLWPARESIARPGRHASPKKAHRQDHSTDGQTDPDEHDDPGGDPAL